MTDIPITANERKAQFTGNTGLGPFAFTFNVLVESDLRVLKNNTALTITTEYTVSLNSDGTGSITLTGSGNGAALISSDILTIIGGRQLARTSDYVQGGNLFAGALNEDLDSIVIMMQQLDEKVSRTMRIDAGDVAENLLLPSQSSRANKYLGFNAEGDPVAVSGTTSTLVVSAFAETFLDDGSGQEVLNTLGVTSTVDNLNVLDGITASTSDLNVLDDIAVSTEQLNRTASIPSSGSFGNRNKIINGNFNINQRKVSGTVTLSAGVYGHDRWKAGASGCTYTFSASGGVTTIDITAGSLVQIVEGINVQTGSYVLSWSGTAQMKINGGTAGASGLTESLTGGSNVTIETSGAGTLSLVQLELGSVPTPFEHRLYQDELNLCLRYFVRWSPPQVGTGGSTPVFGTGFCSLSQTVEIFFSMPVQMRVNPTIGYNGTVGIQHGGTITNITSAGLFVYAVAQNGFAFKYIDVSGPFTIGRGCWMFVNPNSLSNYFQADAEL